MTLDRPDAARRLTFVHEPRKLPVVLSQEEVLRLLEAVTSVKYKAALSLAYGAGLRVSEVISLKVADIDSKRMLLRVERGKGGKTRSLARVLAVTVPPQRDSAPRTLINPSRASSRFLALAVADA